jgi:type I restriction enzyme M protein
MIKEKKTFDDLYYLTDELLNLLKSRTTQEYIYFLPLGILLLKWIDDSKERLSLDIPDDYDYNSIETKCKNNNFDDESIVELYNMARNIENKNPIFKDIFTYLCFSDINYVKTEDIKLIIIEYGKFEFKDVDSEKNITGPFIELFLEKLSDDSSSYSFITPKSIKELLSRLFKINENMNIGDITCGTSGILSEIANQCNYMDLNINKINLYGQEINFKVALIGKINLLLHGIINSNIVIKDSLKEPVLNENPYINNADIILSNLPLGLKWNINEIGYRDDFKYNIPSTMNADWLFIQRGLAAINPNGRAAFIVSKGTLVRKTEKKIRELILKDDLIEAVISLPSNLYGSKTMPIEILIINKSKDTTLKNKVLFIDASKDFYKKERGKNALKSAHVDKIINAYHKYGEIEGYSKIVDISMIEKHNSELNSFLYINNDSINLEESKMKFLSEVADIKRGLQLSKTDTDNSKNPENNSYYYIKISDINDDNIEFNEKIKNLSDSKIQSYELKPNDILISARGTLIKLAIYEQGMLPSVFSGNILLIRVKHDYNPYFLKFYLSSPKGREIISSMQGGSTIVALNPNKLKDMLVPDISLEEQNVLAERIKSNESNYKQRIQQAQNIYDQNLKAIDEEIAYFINY